MSESSSNISLIDAVSCLFRIKKFEYNTYKIEHESANGILQVCNLPTSILKIRDEKLTQLYKGTNITENMKYLISYQAAVGFVNYGEKKNAKELWLAEYVHSKEKFDLFSYIVQEQTSEPWNEFVIQGKQAILLRTRTILTNAYLYPNYYNLAGDPMIYAHHDTTLSVFDDKNSETGMT